MTKKWVSKLDHVHPNLLRQIQIETSERLLKQLANIPIVWDHTGTISRPMLVAHGPDLWKVGKLIRRSRLHLERMGLRDRKKPKPSKRWGVCGLCHKYKKLGPHQAEACPSCNAR